MPSISESSASSEGLTKSRASLISEYKKRKQPYEMLRIGQAELPQYLEQGWVVDRELIRGVRIRRHRNLDDQLKNQFWILLYC